MTLNNGIFWIPSSEMNRTIEICHKCAYVKYLTGNFFYQSFGMILTDIYRRMPIVNLNSYDLGDYSLEDLDNGVQYFNGNTQSVSNAYDDDGIYGEDESLITADKRSRHVVSSVF